MGLNQFKYIRVRLNRADMTITQKLTAKKGAVNGNGLEIQITNGSLIEDTTGIELYLNWKHRTVGNQGSEPFSLVDATQGLYRVNYPTEMLNGGVVDADIRVVDDTTVTITTQSLIIKVNAEATNGAVQSANAWNDIQTLVTAKIDHDQRISALEALIILKAMIESPTFTGVPNVPTAALDNNSTQIANTAFVQALLAAFIDSAPATLDTLNELAAALGDDPNFATTITTALGLKAPKSSPAFTDVPTAPTAPVDTNTTQLATTAFVIAQILNDALTAKSPALTGTPTINGIKINSTTLSKTLSTASWVADGVYWKYAIPITEVEAGLISTSTKIELIPLERSTFGTAALFKTYLDLIQNANIQGESISATVSGTGYVNIISMGTKPTSDVTITVVVRGD